MCNCAKKKTVWSAAKAQSTVDAARRPTAPATSEAVPTSDRSNVEPARV